MARPQQKFDEALRPEKRPDPSSYMFVLHVRAKRVAAFVEWVSCGSTRGGGPPSVSVNDSQSLALGKSLRKLRRSCATSSLLFSDELPDLPPQ